MSVKRVFPGAVPRSDGAAAAVEKGNLLWVSSLTPTPPPQGAPVPPVTAQVGDILSQLDSLLSSASAGRGDVVKTVAFFPPSAVSSHYGAQEVLSAFFGQTSPGSTRVMVEALLQPEALIALEAVVHRAPGPRRPLASGAGVEKGDMLWLSGMTGRREVSAAALYPPDLEEQLRILWGHLQRSLAEAGYSFAHVVKTATYLVPTALLSYRTVTEWRRALFGSPSPSITEVVVPSLEHATSHVEVEVVAVKAKKEEVNPRWDRYRGLGVSPAVLAGNLLWTSGILPVNPRTMEPVGVGSLAAQGEQVYTLLGQVVEEAGYSLEDVVKVVEYLTPAALPGRERLDRVRRQFLPDGGYALSQAVVHRLLYPQLLIQVEAVAIGG
jgi:enamine deaminase RidA (YjgF/YER057c/UK114 family)